MKELIKRDSFGVFVAKKNNVSYVDSRVVAQMFDKEHFHVIRDINNLIDDLYKCIEKLDLENPDNIDNPKLGAQKNEYLNIINEFVFDKYKKGIKEYKYCNIGRSAFNLLVMGFTGVKALEVKVQYEQQFRKMQELLEELQKSKYEHKSLSKAIQKFLCDGSPYDKFKYSTEYDRIYKIVLGMRACDFKSEHNLPKNVPIKPFLTKDELRIVDEAMNLNASLIRAGVDKDTRTKLIKQLVENDTED